MTGAGRAADWLSYPDALRAVLENVRPLEPERIPARAAAGRALAENVVSPLDHPPWDNSAMDGFAVRAEDVEGASPADPVVLPVGGEVRAGAFPEGPLRPGTAVRVNTGAPVPEGTTGVIRVEHTDGGGGGRVEIRDDGDARRNVRSAGEDLRKGARALEAGEPVTPAVVGVLASLGRRAVAVARSPRVGVLATGDELAGFEELEEVRAGRKIMNSNSPALAAQLESVGATPVQLGVARDDPESVRARLEGIEELDAVVSTAGVSVGEHDHVKAVLRDLGLEIAFWRAKIRPGSPVTVGRLPRPERPPLPFWGLPGNPVSAMVGFEVFLRPALRKMAGHRRLRRRLRRARTAEPVDSREDLTYFYRVRLEEAPEGAFLSRGDDGLPVAALTGPQGSGILTSMARADGLMIVPEGTARLPAGAPVRVIPLGGRGWTG